MKKNKNPIPYIIIGIFFLFILFIGQFVYKSTLVKDSLVSDDYYKQEIDYQRNIEARKNFLTIKDSSKILYDSGELKVTFPISWNKIKGKILLYHPTDKKMDAEQEFKTTSNQLILKIQTDQNVNWRAKLTFDHNEKKYYWEQNLLSL